MAAIADEHRPELHTIILMGQLSKSLNSFETTNSLIGILMMVIVWSNCTNAYLVRVHIAIFVITYNVPSEINLIQAPPCDLK